MRQNRPAGAGHVPALGAPAGSAGTGRRALTGTGVVVTSSVVALVAGILPATATGATAAGGVRTASAEPAPAVAVAALARTQVRSLDVPVTRDTSARGESTVVAQLRATPTQTFGLVGVTWKPGTAAQDTTASIRTLAGGTWSTWTHLGGCTCSACLGSRAEDADSEIRVGTAPTWVGVADGVAVRVISSSGRAPRGISVETIEPDRTALAAGVGTSDTSQRVPEGFPGIPDVVTRKEWGADRALVEKCSDPRYGMAARAVAVHHTVNSNSYSRSDSPALMRSILAYHTQSQGWCDVGYNFVVDRYGMIFEGRRGGMRLPVRGSHAGDHNTDTVGISMLGNFDVAPLTKRLRNAMVRLIGWRLGTSYMPARGTARVPAGRVRRIFGHRDVMSTACPGRYGYAFLPRLRERVATYTSRYDSPLKRKARALGTEVTGPVFMGERSLRGGLRTRFSAGAMYNKRPLGTHWLQGGTHRAYTRFGGVHGALGYPRSDVRRTVIDRVFAVRFAHGTVYRVGKKRAYQVRGRILLRYAKLGGLAGRLGPPRITLTRNGPREKVTFRRGRIVHNRENGNLNVIYP